MSIPMDGCGCNMCERARAKAERPRTYSLPIAGSYDPIKGTGGGRCDCLSCTRLREQQATRPASSPFGQAISDLYDTLSKIKPLPFESEPEAEPVYTHVLLDYDDEDQPMFGYGEFHTAESLIGAIKLRKDDSVRYQVFELGESILDVIPA